MRAFLAVSIALSLALLTGWNTSGLKSELDDHGKALGLDAHEDHAAVSLLGQMRTSVSSWLWLKADLYLHNGVEMRPRTEEEIKSGVAAEKPAQGEEVHSEANVTVVPPKEDDFRGIFGDLERATTAYKSMAGHKHNDPTSAMPMFRLMTWLDPNFVPGWTTGANILARDKSNFGFRKSMEFLSDGLNSNPESVEMRVEYGNLQLDMHRDLSVAERVFFTAVETGKRRLKYLDEDEQVALEQAYRWLSLCERDLGKRDEMVSVATEGLKLYPDDAVLARLLAEPPLILSDKGVAIWRQQHSVAITH